MLCGLQESRPARIKMLRNQQMLTVARFSHPKVSKNQKSMNELKLIKSQKGTY